MSNSNIVNSIGLVLDIAGAILIWKFGLPTTPYEKGSSYLMVRIEVPEETAKAMQQTRWSRIGISLLILGFACQLVSNCITD